MITCHDGILDSTLYCVIFRFQCLRYRCQFLDTNKTKPDKDLRFQCNNNGPLPAHPHHETIERACIICFGLRIALNTPCLVACILSEKEREEIYVTQSQV